jgi:putative ATP-dependent endonuclease of OLD family
MRITKVFIRNYKSISRLEFEPNPAINVFIGENSVGKSNIFDAMNWLLGPTYPSFNATQEQDHYLGKPDNIIKIKLDYDNSPYLELAEEWEDPYGHIKKGLNCSGNYVNDEIRQDYASAYLGIDRKILDYLPSNRWSLLGRLLLEINKRFKEEIIEQDGVEISKADLFKEKLI